MPLNFISKYGIVVGSLSIALSFVTLHENYDVIDFRKVYQNDHDISYFLLMGVLSVFLILGILKKCCWLIAPSLMTGILGSTYITSKYIGKAWQSQDFDDFLFVIMQLGAEIIILYPLCNLFIELNQGRTTAAKSVNSARQRGDI